MHTPKVVTAQFRESQRFMFIDVPLYAILKKKGGGGGGGEEKKKEKKKAPVGCFSGFSFNK